jgi:hypothetical protein
MTGTTRAEPRSFDEVGAWAAKLQAGQGETRRLVANSLLVLRDFIASLPDSDYRGQALCRLSDTAALAFVAAAAPPPAAGNATATAEN